MPSQQTTDGEYLAAEYSEAGADKHSTATLVKLDASRNWPPRWEKRLMMARAVATLFSGIETATAYVGVGS